MTPTLTIVTSNAKNSQEMGTVLIKGNFSLNRYLNNEDNFYFFFRFCIAALSVHTLKIYLTHIFYKTYIFQISLLQCIKIYYFSLTLKLVLSCER